MTVQLNGVTIELPNNAKVDVSEDGNSVKVSLPEQQVVEKIRLVPSTEPKVVEKIKIVEKPCALLHYPPYCNQPHYPCNLQHYPSYPINPWGTWGTTGGTVVKF